MMAVDCRSYPLTSSAAHSTLRSPTEGSASGFAGLVDTDDVPMFSPEKLRRCLGDVLSKDAYSTIYSLKGYPHLAAKEIRPDDPDQYSVDAAKLKLVALPNTSYPDVLSCGKIIKSRNTIFIIMDRRCGDLQQLITNYRETHKPIPKRLVLSLVRDLANCLIYLHDPINGVHGSLFPGVIFKPDNILFTENRRHIVLANFELCMGMSSWATKTGDPAYMAPETLLRGIITPASNIWSIGAIAYELATLRKPDFLGGREPEDVFVDGWRPDLSGITDGFIKSVLERIFVLDPERRPTARGLVRLLQMLNGPPDEQEAKDKALRNRCASLEAALNDANNKILSLEKELAAKSAGADIPKEQFGETSKTLEKVKEIWMKIGMGDAWNATDTADTTDTTDTVDAIDTTDETDNIEDTEEEHLEEDDSTDLMRAVDRNDVEAVKTLIPLQGGMQMKGCTHVDRWKICGGTALMRAAIHGHTELVGLLLEKEGGIRDNSGWTALIWAARTGHIDCLELLLEREGGMRDNNGGTALMATVGNGYSNCARSLLRKEICMQDNNGTTALMAAAGRGYTDCVKLLMKKESRMQDGNGWTALMCAAELGRTDCVKLLVELEGGMQRTDGMTALMWAAQNRHVDCVRLLVDKEAGMKEKTGWTALMFAMKIGSIDCVKLLVREKSLRDSTGGDALCMAKLWGCHEIVSLLSNEVLQRLECCC
ncbi:Kinase, NEK [Giardia duodenalis]|uniref:Kinase, NEK n=1 Tax=Giardia intestinalis (strain ATCC 50803 / WB clone C6) TaxID=184922 RepID=A8BMV2_GIAIC|nr:Kinase, NEK [Giardia intestinalis]KAE8305599.1 Kinase, NEK [Giardia intestinalis]|eukprot:XP_001705969.1 Kinase, NEK [Giardia lamblia ATCC 50803]